MVKRIDPHVHFRDGEQNYKETIKHGLELAKAQGVDYVFDMPNTQKLILRKEDVINRLKLVPKDYKERYFLYVGVTCDENQIREAVDVYNEFREVIGIKMFAGKSTGNLAIISEDEQRFVYEKLAELDYRGVLAIHCEKESFMNEEVFDFKNPISHARSRPNIAEVESLKDQIKFAKEFDFKGNIHICHISCKDSVGLVKSIKKEGLIKISCGVTPHHVLWNEQKLNEDNGLLFKMNPPLRSQVDVDFLRDALRAKVIDFIETDHAPHSVGEKLFASYPSGFPSLYLYKDFVEDFLINDLGLSQSEVEDLTFNNIVKIFNLNLI